jgi:2',3'-cyclic-nucleotide 2'-phosphodiesterase (5'-nucleotidase family)
MHVTAENYEKVVTELDLRFHASTQKQRIDSAASTPVEIKKKAHTARNKAVASAVKKPAPKKGAKKAKKR